MQKEFQARYLLKISFLLGKGYTLQEIADEMGIHRVTVSRYKKEIRGEK